MSASSDPPVWLRATPDGVALAVHVVPGASRAGVVGRHGDALRVRVTAPPAGGAANRELLQVLADALGVRGARVAIARGGASRQKLVHIRGLTVAEVQGRLGGGTSVDTARARH